MNHELLIDLKQYDDVVFYLYRNGKFVDCYMAKYKIGQMPVRTVRYPELLPEGGYDPSSEQPMSDHLSVKEFDTWLRGRIKELGADVVGAVTRKTKVIYEAGNS